VVRIGDDVALPCYRPTRVTTICGFPGYIVVFFGGAVGFLFYVPAQYGAHFAPGGGHRSCSVRDGQSRDEAERPSANSRRYVCMYVCMYSAHRHKRRHGVVTRSGIFATFPVVGRPTKPRPPLLVAIRGSARLRLPSNDFERESRPLSAQYLNLPRPRSNGFGAFHSRAIIVGKFVCHLKHRTCSARDGMCAILHDACCARRGCRARA
jgi:hypothetical protein